MAVNFDKIKPGMVLYERRSECMGNTTLRSISEWNVQVLKVDQEKFTAIVRWNGNKPEKWDAFKLRRLYTWSMYDTELAEVTKGLWGAVMSVRKKKKSQ